MKENTPKPTKRLNQLTSLIRKIQQKDEAAAPELPSPAPTPEPDPAPKATEPKKIKPQTYIIVGLGNPGKEYAKNRHNIGFMAVDRLADRLGLTFSRMQNRALVCDTLHEEHKLILVKPQTYMNESGQSVAALMKFYKVRMKNLLLMYDDMDIPLGTIRIRPQGGSGGQKGVKSTIERLGNSNNFPRIRLGIGRPPGQMPPPAYLLQDFHSSDLDIVSQMLDTTSNAVLTYVTEGLNKAMNVYNGAIDK